MSTEDLINSISHTPEEVARLLLGLSSEQMRARPSVEEFSAAEQVCHLRDIEVEGYLVRIRRMLAEENPVLPDVDGARLAAERDYNSENIVDALQAFADARKQSVAALTNLDETSLSQTGALEGVGEIALSRLVAMMHEHDVGHLEELNSLRRRLLRTNLA